MINSSFAIWFLSVERGLEKVENRLVFVEFLLIYVDYLILTPPPAKAVSKVIFHHRDTEKLTIDFQNFVSL